jgi:hypothetical protein
LVSQRLEADGIQVRISPGLNRPDRTDASACDLVRKGTDEAQSSESKRDSGMAKPEKNNSIPQI